MLKATAELTFTTEKITLGLLVLFLTGDSLLGLILSKLEFVSFS